MLPDVRTLPKKLDAFPALRLSASAGSTCRLCSEPRLCRAARGSSASCGLPWRRSTCEQTRVRQDCNSLKTERALPAKSNGAPSEHDEVCLRTWSDLSPAISGCTSARQFSLMSRVRNCLRANRAGGSEVSPLAASESDSRDSSRSSTLHAAAHASLPQGSAALGHGDEAVYIGVG